MRISKREAKFIHPAVVYRWEINIQHWRKSAMWDDDPLMPVKIGR